MPFLNGFEFYFKIRNKIHDSKICFFSASEYTDNKTKNIFPELKEQQEVLIQKSIKIKDIHNKIMEIINESDD